jgi:UDP-4-amino-4,6-dideoxy-N-acetyl-beta-L-altrosamine N-acetyltransferase
MLIGKRIQLRAIEEEDLKLISKWRNDPGVYDYFYEYEPISFARQLKWYERQLENPTEKNFLVASVNGEAIGTASIVHLDFRNSKAEYGRLLIGSEKFRGKGIGTEIDLLIIQYSFDHLNLNRLYCEVLVKNESVIRLHMKTGFREEGILKQYVYKNGMYEDVALLTILRQDYIKEMSTGNLGKLYKEYIHE